MEDKDTLINEILTLAEGLRTATDTLVTIVNRTGTDLHIKHYKNEAHEECFIVNNLDGSIAITKDCYAIADTNNVTLEVGFEEPLFDRCGVETTIHNERPSLRTKANISREIRERLEQIVKIGTIHLSVMQETAFDIYLRCVKITTGDYILVLAGEESVKDPEFLAEWSKYGEFLKMKDNKVKFNISIRV